MKCLFGENALPTSTGSPNDALGYEAGYYISTGTDNIAVGGFVPSRAREPSPKTSPAYRELRPRIWPGIHTA